jgi:hypothetical protein
MSLIQCLWCKKPQEEVEYEKTVRGGKTKLVSICRCCRGYRVGTGLVECGVSCSRCGSILSLQHFHRNKTTKSGFSKTCKKCMHSLYELRKKVVSPVISIKMSGNASIDESEAKESIVEEVKV